MNWQYIVKSNNIYIASWQNGKTNKKCLARRFDTKTDAENKAKECFENYRIIKV